MYGEERTISKRMIYLDSGREGVRGRVQFAPYLDFRPLQPHEPSPGEILGRQECAWIGCELERQAAAYAVEKVVPEHLLEIDKARQSAHRQDGGGGQGPAHEGDLPLGPPRRGPEAP